ncbi:MAG TPA: glycoside hydrolase family 19 [Oxalobacteraceae bacterium]|nr:glycoside hydrolase family 19 [Oxalobacteraceae bacterium]
MPITAAQLRLIMPAAGAHADVYAGPLSAAMAQFSINTISRASMFLAHVGHESASLICVEENLNYSAEALHSTWPSHFDLVASAAYAHKPALIANRAYANRDGNGDEASGDGYKFRGRGPFQITGRANYKACGDAIGHDLISNPDLLTTPEVGALSAAWFWSSHGLNKIADVGDFRCTTQRINGGMNGYSDRLAFLMRAEATLGKVK